MTRWTSHFSRPAGVGLALVVALGLGACGSSGTGSGSPGNRGEDTGAGTRPAQPTFDVCAAVTAADAGEVFGEPAEVRVATQAEPLVSGVCMYGAASDEFAVRHLLQLRVYEGSEFYGEKIFPNAKPLESLGDEAFVAVNVAGHMVDVQFVKDGKTGIVNYTADASVDLAAKVAAVEAVAAQLAEAM